MSELLDVLKLFLGWPFATLWEIHTLDSHFHEPLTEKEQEKNDSVLFACIGGISSLATMVLLAGWKTLLACGLDLYPLPWQFAIPTSIVSIGMYAIGFITVLNADNEEDCDLRQKPLRTYDPTRTSDIVLVAIIVGANAIAASFWVLLGMVFWWVVFIYERPRLKHSYGDLAGYRLDMLHAIGGGVMQCAAVGFLAAALLSGLPGLWIGFGIALGSFIILSAFYHGKVKENPKFYGWG